ncbi:MAG: TolB family protein [Blastocatellales bacterium]
MKSHKLIVLVSLILSSIPAPPINAQSAPRRPGKAPVLISASGFTGGVAGADSYLNADSPRSSLSGDGRFVLFQSQAGDVVSDVSDGNFATDVFVRDRLLGKTILVSVNRDGTATGNGPSVAPRLSADGRFVAFESFAGDLIAGDDNGAKDIFVHDLQTGVTRLVTVNSAGQPSRGGALFVNLYGVSADGRYALFTSEARDLVENDKNDSADLFVRDVVAEKTVLISVNTKGQASGNRTPLTSGGFFNFAPVISADGRFVVFASYANDLVENDRVCFGRCDGTNGLEDVFVRDLLNGATTLVSVNLKGDNGGVQGSHQPSMSADGRFVAFRSFATDLVANDRTEQADIFVRDLQTGVTKMASVNLTGDNGGTSGGAGVNAHNPIISPNGRYVAFSSTAVDLAANKTDGSRLDVFVRDLKKGETALVSAMAASVGGSGLFSSVAADFSADGRFLVFRSTAPDLAANDFNQLDDIFVRDLRAGKTALVSRNRLGVSGAGRSLTADISADGRVIAFDSDAPDIVASDANNAFDVFVVAGPPRLPSRVPE